MKTFAIIEARMTSTRLPGKILLPVLGRPLLELLIERLKNVPSLDGIIVATTSNPTDDIVEELTKKVGVLCFRGSEEDVLNRVLSAAEFFFCDVIVEITGDCPLVDPEIVEKLIMSYHTKEIDYASNALKITYPLGMETQIFSTSVLRKVAALTNDPIDHEHVSLYIYEHPEVFSLFNLESNLPEKYWNVRLTVDTEEDFLLVKTIFEYLYPKNPFFNLKEIIDFLEKKHNLLNINQHILQKKAR